MIETMRRMAIRVLVVVALAGAVAPLAHAAGRQQPPPQPPAGQSEFVPVSELPEAEQLPAAPLLIAAYAVAWVALLAYVWALWRRLAGVEKEIANVSRRIESGQRRS